MPLTCLYLMVLIMFSMGNIIRVSTIQMRPLFWHVLFGHISTVFYPHPPFLAHIIILSY